MYGLSQLFEVPPDATLGDLVIEGAANSESISLSPAFDDDTFTYTAAVPTGIDAVRLTATTNDSNSTVAITGDSDTSTPNTADFDLDLGANTLSLTVTAEDGTTQTYTITVTQLGTPPPPATVTSNWILTPDGVSGGQQFRLIFYSSTKRDAQSDDIEDYNTFVQARAAAGHAKIRQYSDGFTAVGCTEDADARDNTQTRYTDSNTGVPIYWLADSRSPTTTGTSTTGPGTRRPTTRTGTRSVTPDQIAPKPSTTPGQGATTTAPRLSSHQVTPQPWETPTATTSEWASPDQP